MRTAVNDIPGKSVNDGLDGRVNDGLHGLVKHDCTAVVDPQQVVVRR